MAKRTSLQLTSSLPYTKRYAPGDTVYVWSLQFDPRIPHVAVVLGSAAGWSCDLSTMKKTRNPDLNTDKILIALAAPHSDSWIPAMIPMHATVTRSELEAIQCDLSDQATQLYDILDKSR